MEDYEYYEDCENSEDYELNETAKENIHSFLEDVLAAGINDINGN